MATNHQIVLDRQVGKQLHSLERPPDAELDAVVQRRPGDVASTEDHRAVGERRENPADGVEEGCLAGAVRTDEAVDGAFAHREGDVFESDNPAEADGDGSRFQERLAGVHQPNHLRLRRYCFTS